MAGDLHAAAEPDRLVRLGVVDEPLERRHPAGPSDQPAVQAHRHHSRRLLPFRVEHVEAVLQVGVELVARVEALHRREAHVVGVERVGHD